MTGGGFEVGGELQEKYDRSGTFLSGETERSGTVQGVWGGDSAWVARCKYADT